MSINRYPGQRDVKNYSYQALLAPHSGGVCTKSKQECGYEWREILLQIEQSRMTIIRNDCPERR